MLTKRLYNKGFNKQQISNLYKFIDFLISLPKELEIEYLEDVEQIEKVKKMAYITSAERLGMERGMEKGVLLGAAQEKEKVKIRYAKRMLGKGLNLSIIAEITEIPLKKIKLLQKEESFIEAN